MRTSLLLATLLAIALSSPACLPPPQAQPEQSELPPSEPVGQDACGAACAHYLECKGVGDEAQWSSCTEQCQTSDLDPDVVAAYPQMDCASAIQLVEGGGGQPGEPQPAGACTADCTGCVWDGTQCYHHAMAMMGSTIDCEACCCAAGGPAQRWD